MLLSGKGTFIGFTLAEILITLGIVGVVVAMTIPALINDIQNKQLEAGLKKGYSTAQQALISLQADEGIINSNYGTRSFADKYINYFNGAINCGYVMGTTTTNTNTLCVTSKTYYKSYNGKANAYSPLLDDGQFVLPDGTNYFIQNQGANPSDNLKGSLLITIDVNGTKKPNKWGHDLFTFQLMDNGKLTPMGAKGTDYYEQECSQTSSSGRNGIGCTYKALNDPNYFKSLP